MSAPRHPGGTLRLPARPRDQAAAPLAPTPPSQPGTVPAMLDAPAPPDPTEAAARKQANLQRERDEHVAAVVRRRQQTRDILALLRERWPEVFTTPVPLAAGIAREIREGLGETWVPTAQLSRALYFWTHAPDYLDAVVAGQRRRHLDGTDAGEPDEAQQQHAREIIAQRAARRSR